MKILFIAPLPPPLNGQALASQVFLSEIQNKNDLTIINTAEQPSKYFALLTRLFEVFMMLLKIRKGVRKAELIYLTISESRLGNIKDIITYLICYKKLDRMFVHLHGGAGMIKIMRGKSATFLKRINIFFLKRLRGAIILGQSHATIFKDAVAANRIYVVPNFAEDYLFSSKGVIERKYNNLNMVKILYMSNMIFSKGYMDLLDAYLSLDDASKSKISIDFAGAFFNNRLKKEFLHKVNGIRNVYYHGVVKGTEKQKLFEDSHIFCLPTYFPYEGQPISILEAYAAGCAVITTNHSGIRDIFTDKVNGYQVEKESVESIRSVLKDIIKSPDVLLSIGHSNNHLAQGKYRVSIYNKSLKRIMGI